MKNGQKWSLEEKDILRQCSGMEVPEITKLIKRNGDAIRNMARLLGVPIKGVNINLEHKPDISYDGNANFLFTSMSDLKSKRLVR